MKIVLVHSGETLPSHLIANLNALKRTFPQKEVVTLVDASLLKKELIMRGFSSYLCKSHSEGYESLTKKLSHDSSFFGGFWFKTLKRFFMLHEFMKHSPQNSIIHIESDVVLLPGFPFEDFLKLREGLAYPLVNNSHAAASIFFVKNFQALDSFLIFLDGAQVNKNDTDMTLLSKFAQHNQSVFILPTLLPNSELNVDCRMVASDEHFFQGIFDAATYGQYLFGLDPRHFFGIRKLFYSPPDHSIAPSKFRYSVESHSKMPGLRVYDNLNNSAPLFNLHIHSKDLRVFQQILLMRHLPNDEVSIRNGCHRMI